MLAVTDPEGHDFRLHTVRINVRIQLVFISEIEHYDQDLRSFIQMI